MAANTMDAIKKKMQAMKLEKESALDKADQLEQKLTDQKETNEKVSTPYPCPAPQLFQSMEYRRPKVNEGGFL